MQKSLLLILGLTILYIAERHNCIMLIDKYRNFFTHTKILGKKNLTKKKIVLASICKKGFESLIDYKTDKGKKKISCYKKCKDNEVRVSRLEHHKSEKSTYYIHKCRKINPCPKGQSAMVTYEDDNQIVERCKKTCPEGQDFEYFTVPAGTGTRYVNWCKKLTCLGSQVPRVIKTIFERKIYGCMLPCPKGQTELNGTYKIKEAVHYKYWCEKKCLEGFEKRVVEIAGSVRIGICMKKCTPAEKLVKEETVLTNSDFDVDIHLRIQWRCQEL